MEIINSYNPGSFCWIELGTKNCKEANKFYSDLFNWMINETPTGHGGTYNLLSLEGYDIAGSYELSSEQIEQNVPPHWLPYVSVNNAKETAEKSAEFNGKIIVQDIQVDDDGRLSVLQDPNGAFFAVWQAVDHIGSKIKGTAGSYCWVELGTNNINSSKEYYSKLFNWDIKEDNFDGLEYFTFKNGPISEGGMYKLPPELSEIPPHWLIYFYVNDCDVTVEKAKSLGAKILKEPESIDRVGRFSVIQDPQGAIFAVIKLEMT